MKYQVSVKVTQYGTIAVEAQNFNEAKVLAELQYSKGNTNWIDNNAELDNIRELSQTEISKSSCSETYGLNLGCDAMKVVFNEVEILKRPMLFTPSRIDRRTVPEGLYIYEVRRNDIPTRFSCQIANWIVFDFWGTLISNKPLPLTSHQIPGNAYRNIEYGLDWDYTGQDYTLQEYVEKHPPKKEKRQDFERRR